MRYYTLYINKDGQPRLKYVTDDTPNWANYTFVDKPFSFQVIHPKEINDTISKFFNSMMTTAGNYKTIFDKILRSKILGISRSDVTEYLKTNPIQRQQLANTNSKGYVKSYRPKYPFHYWQIDHIVLNNLPGGGSKYKNILVIIDIFSKFLYIVPCYTKEMDEVVSILEKIFLNGDIPEILGGDGAFDNTKLKTFLQSFNVEFRSGLPYSPQTQGFVENKNKQIKSMISIHFLKYNTRTYHNILDHIAFTINNTKHSITKMTPFLLHRGRDISFKGIEADIATAVNDFEDGVQLIQHYRKEESCDKLSREDIKNYEKSSKLLHDSRVEHVRGLIHNEAEKREKKFDAMSLPPLTLEQKVFIMTYTEPNDTEILPVFLKLISEGDYKEFKLESPLQYFKQSDRTKNNPIFVTKYKRYPKGQFSRLLGKVNKYSWKIPPKISGIDGNFIVEKVIDTPRRSSFYNISYIGNNNHKWKVVRFLGYKQTFNEIWEDRFPRNMLLGYKTKEAKTAYKPTVQYIDLVKRDTSQFTVSNAIQEVHAEEYNTTIRGTHLDARELYQKELNRLLKHKATSKNKKTKLEKVRIVCSLHVRGIINTTPSKFVHFPGQINYWTGSDAKNKGYWHVTFDDEPTIYTLPLHPEKYSLELADSMWFFENPQDVITRFKS
jgi:hypothetical protein